MPDRPGTGVHDKATEVGDRHDRRTHHPPLEPADIPARHAAITASREHLRRWLPGAVRTVRAGGPYRLGSWCMGGAIAHSTARHLRASGEEVDLLVMIDSSFADPVPPEWVDDEAAAIVGAFANGFRSPSMNRGGSSPSGALRTRCRSPKAWRLALMWAASMTFAGWSRCTGGTRWHFSPTVTARWYRIP
jgi:Thioesterase domain